jgi:hypothetical protein
MIAVVIVTSVGVFFDARSLGVKKTTSGGFLNLAPIGWMLCCMLAWIVVFPLYLIKRPSLRREFQQQTQAAGQQTH